MDRRVFSGKQGSNSPDIGVDIIGNIPAFAGAQQDHPYYQVRKGQFHADHFIRDLSVDIPFISDVKLNIYTIEEITAAELLE